MIPLRDPLEWVWNGGWSVSLEKISKVPKRARRGTHSQQLNFLTHINYIWITVEHMRAKMEIGLEGAKKCDWTQRGGSLIRETFHFSPLSGIPNPGS